MRIFRIHALLVALFIVPLDLNASTILYRTDAELVARSHRVIHGRPIAQRAVWADAPGGRIYTVTTLAVIEDLTGQPGDVVEVWELGGVIGDRFTYISGAVEFTRGQDVLICLERGPRGYRSVAMGFSVFTVRRASNDDGWLTRATGAAAVVGDARQAPVGERSLAQFRDLVAETTGQSPRRVDSVPQPGGVTAQFTKLGGEPGYRWRKVDDDLSLDWYVNAAQPTPLLPGNDTVHEVRTALGAWSDRPMSSLRLRYAGTVRETSPSGPWKTLPDGNGLITFEDPENALGDTTLAIGGGDGSFGTGGSVRELTFNGFDRGYVIFQKRINLSNAFRRSPNFTRVLTHEIGHALGLGHTQTDGTIPNPTSNIMYFNCCHPLTPLPGQLGPDDLEGIAFFYPGRVIPPPTIALDRTSLRFGGVTSGSVLTLQTSPHTITLTQSGTGVVPWTAVSTHPWLQVSPSSGIGPAVLTVSVSGAGGLPAEGVLTGAIAFTLTDASNQVAPVAVTFTLVRRGASTPPVGYLDTPIDNLTGVTGAIPVTGWAVDDIEMDSVAICRAPHGLEPTPPDSRCGSPGQIFVGHAVFIEGARPDVLARYPDTPRANVAGWGFMILTNTLPGRGNGDYRLFAWAADREGYTVLLGARTISCANSGAHLPFGTIDTPRQGETIAGTNYINFGWALTPWPKEIDRDGSTITVYVDGVAIGKPSYDHSRTDIEGLFRELRNSDGAVGFLPIDTTALPNGLHTIAWTVIDGQGDAAGIGSRFFRVANPSSATRTSLSVTAGLSATAPSPAAGRAAIDAAAADLNPLTARRGWNEESPWRSYGGGSARAVIHGEELDRFEIALDARHPEQYAGFLKAGDDLLPLPAGSRLDPSTGFFTWSPGPGFVGDYDLVFVRSSGGVPVGRRDVRVIIHPKGSGLVGPQVVIDTPRPDQQLSQPFAVAGWAADLGADASLGTGIATLHAWAYPVHGGAPLFVGASPYGGHRPDVAAIHGDQFRPSGFHLAVSSLPPGTYDLALFAWSSVAGRFEPARTVRVTVQ